MSPEENKSFMSMFKMCGKGDSIDCFYQEHNDEMETIQGKVFTRTLLNYARLVYVLFYFDKCTYKVNVTCTVLFSLVRKMVIDNPLQTCFQKFQTKLK